MSRRSTGWPTPPAPHESAGPERATTPPPPEYDPDSLPPSRRATEPPVADYGAVRESCSSFEAGLEGIASGAAPLPADDSHFVYAAVLTGEDLDWFPLSDASLRVVGALDGQRSMRDVAMHLDIDNAQASGIARDLLARGIISLRGVG